MRACNVDIDKLRRNVVTYVESELEKLATDGSEDSKPTAGLQRTIQRAVIHVQSSGHEEVTGANVLVAWPCPYATSKISSTTFNNAASPSRRLSSRSTPALPRASVSSTCSGCSPSSKLISCANAKWKASQGRRASGVYAGKGRPASIDAAQVRALKARGPWCHRDRQGARDRAGERLQTGRGNRVARP
jgi:hypothetical protein